ncbi:MAG: hypothetical protein RRY10_02925 [Christensenellaceae bacterium]
MENKKDKGFVIVAILTVIFSIAYLIGIFGFIAESSFSQQMALPLPVVLSFLYGVGAFAVVCVLVLMIALITLKNKREIVAKIFSWGVLLFTLLYTSGLYVSLLQLSSLTNLDAFNFIASYIPSIAVCVTFIAMISQWDSSDKKAVNMIALVSVMVSLFMVVFTTVQAFGSLMTTVPAAIYALIYSVALGIVNLFVLIGVFMITRSRRTFDKRVFAMSDEEAEMVEKIEDRVEEIADEVEDMAAEINNDRVSSIEDAQTVIVEEEIIIEEENVDKDNQK